MLIAALAAVRAFGDRAAGVLLGCAAVPYAAATGLLVPPIAAGGWGNANLLAAAAAATATAVLARVATGEAGPLLLGLGTVSAAATLGGLLAAVTPLTNGQSAAIVVVLGLLTSPLIPSLSFWLAGLRLPDVPTTVEDIGRDVDPVPEDVMTTQ